MKTALVSRQIVCANGRVSRWGHVKAHGDPLQLRARSRIQLHDQRIMPWNDVALVRRKCKQPVEPLQHFTDMKRGRERTLTRHILVKMADVGGQHDKSPACPDPNELKPGRMASGRMDRNAWRELGVAI